MLIVAPPPAAQPDNSAHSEDSRSTSASDHSIPSFSLVSREKLNNFSDSSDSSDRGRPYLRAQGVVHAWGVLGAGKRLRTLLRASESL